MVSKFYLRYFADDNDRVTTVMLPGDRTFPQSIGDASVQTDYYNVIDQEGQLSDAAEQALSLVEVHAATAWREVAAGVWPLPDGHRMGTIVLHYRFRRSSGCHIPCQHTFAPSAIEATTAPCP